MNLNTHYFIFGLVIVVLIGGCAPKEEKTSRGLIEESARSFIGQLDPSVQEKFAYKNAEKLLQER